MMTPVVVVPMMMVPVAMVPTMMPMAVMPVVVMPVTVMMVAHLHGLHLVDFVLRHDCRRGSNRRRYRRRLDRRNGRGLCACSKQERACHQSSAELQEIPKFHDFMPLLNKVREGRAVSSSEDERWLNSSRDGSAHAQNGSSVARKSRPANAVDDSAMKRHGARLNSARLNNGR
jgi:hypothetical protein